MRLALCLLLLAACAAPPPSDPDAGIAPDAGAAAAFDTCEGACRTTTLAATFGGKTRAFDRAELGLTAPSEAASGGWELYVEAHAGGDPACPTEHSPTPDMTLVLSGLALPGDETPRTEADGLHATFFDFEGSLTDEPLLKAIHVTVTPRHVRACWPAADAGTCEGDSFAALDLEAEFAGGTVRGALFATHCEAFDAP